MPARRAPELRPISKKKETLIDKERVMNSRPKPRTKPPIPRQGGEPTHLRGRISRANPEDFGKQTTGVRERMARDVKEMSPEDRLKQGR